MKRLMLVMVLLLASAPAFAKEVWITAGPGWSPSSGCTRDYPCDVYTVFHQHAVVAEFDTVRFLPGVYTQLTIQVSLPLTLVGSGRGQTIIHLQSGTGAPAISVVKPNPPREVTTATFRSMTILGSQEAYFGGSIAALANVGQNVTIEDCEIASGGARDGGGAGGVVAYGGTTTIVNSDVHDNNAYLGRAGAIGLHNGGTLTISGSTIRNNYAMGAGGGIYTDGETLITNTTIVGNASGQGGGIYAASGSTVNLRNVTVVGNRAGADVAGGRGAGIFVAPGGYVNVQNSTIAMNTATPAQTAEVNGGGIYSYGTLVISQSTIVRNEARPLAGGLAHQIGIGGGIFVAGGSATIQNSILAQNVADAGPDCAGPLQSTTRGHNVLGSSAGCGGIANGDAFNQAGTLEQPLDPLLGTFGNYGGPMSVIPVLAGSPARGRGNTLVCRNTNGDNDQRGAARHTEVRGACDIGAYDQTGFLGPTIALEALSDSGLPGDYTTNVRTPRFAGRADPGQTVRVIEVVLFAPVLCQAVADTWGDWSCMAPAMSDRTYRVGAEALRKTNDLWGGTTELPIITIDTTLPGITIDSATFATRSAEFTFSSIEPAARVTCQLDGGLPQTCTSPSSYSGLAGGNHTFRVTATDLAGNFDFATRTWSVDNTPPAVSILTGPTAIVNAASFTWAGSDDVSAAAALRYRYRLHRAELDEPWSAFASITSASVTPPADGQYTFEVQVQDETGNVSAAGGWNFTGDVTPPSIGLLQPADVGFYERYSLVTTLYSCADQTSGMDGGICAGPVASGSPLDTSLGTLQHYFTVHAQDAAGNHSEMSVPYKLFNPIPIVQALNPGAAARTASTLVTVVGTKFVPESQVVLVSPSGTAAMAQSVSVALDRTRITVELPTDPETGAWQINVVNPSWRYDPVNPPIGGGKSGPLWFWVTAPETLVESAAVSPTGTATVGGDGPNTSGSLTVTGAGGEGVLGALVYASNPAGTPTFTSSGVFFDAYVQPNSSYTSVTIVACHLLAGNFLQWWDGTRWSVASRQAFDPDAGCVIATIDASTRPSLAQMTGTVFGGAIDVTPPATTMAATAGAGPYSPGTWTANDVELTLNATDDAAGSGVAATWYRIDGGTAQPYTAPLSFSNEGIVTLELWSVDISGNVETARTATIDIDRTPPSVTASAGRTTLWPANGKLVAVVVSGIMTDALSGIGPGTATFEVNDEYGLVQPSGGVPVAADGSYSFTVMLEASRLGPDTDGRRYSVVVRASDRAGHQASQSTLITVPHDRRSDVR